MRSLAIRDRVGRWASWLAFGDLLRYGLPPPALAGIVDVPGVLDARGHPRSWKADGARGLYFVGYDNVATGLFARLAVKPRPWPRM